MAIDKRWILALKITVSVLLIALLLSQIDTQLLAETLSDIAPGLALFSLIIIFLQVVPAVLRWSAVLEASGASLGFWQGCRLFFVGVFFNQTLPSAIGGDAVRIYFVYREGLSLRNAVNSVLLERIVSIAALVILVLAFYPFFSSELSETTRSWFQPLLILIAALLSVGITGLLCLNVLFGRWRHWRLVRALSNLAEDAHNLCSQRKLLLKSFWWALVANGTVSFAVYILALSLDLDVSLVACQVLVPLANLMTMLPISIAGWGIREGTMVLLLGLIGVTSENALLLSILFGLTAVASAVPGAFLWLAKSGLRKEYDTEFRPRQV